MIPSVDREEFEMRLRKAFDGDDSEYRAVSRQARDLADSGRIEDGFDYELTGERVVDHLRDAPDDYALAERWNWWIESLELSNGGYQRFRVRPDIA